MLRVQGLGFGVWDVGRETFGRGGCGLGRPAHSWLDVGLSWVSKFIGISVGDALEGLDEGARQRVLDWAAGRFGMTGQAHQSERALQRNGSGGPAGERAFGSTDSRDFASISDLFDRANPDTNPDRALVAAYWFQVVQNSESFAGQQINDELKHMGHGLSNVTKSLSDLANKSPSLVRQVQKIGKSKQGRKKYRLTLEGERRVQRLLRGERPNESND